jgi:TonB family protein
MGRNLFLRLKGGCLAAAALFASPAFADDDLVLAPTGEWTLREQTDRCRLSRTFGAGEDAVTLYLDQTSGGPFYNLTVIGRPFGNPYGPAMNVQFGPDEKPSLRSYVHATSSKGRPSLTMFGLTLAPPIIVEGETFPVDELSPERRRAIAYLRLSRSIARPVRLELGAVGDLLVQMQACAGKLEGRLNFAGQVYPPRLLNPDELGRLIRYPTYLIRSSMEGVVDFRLTVNEAGKPTACSILESTRPQLFDDEVCLSLLRHAKFKGATDAEGKPVVTQYRSSVRFAVAR